MRSNSSLVKQFTQPITTQVQLFSAQKSSVGNFDVANNLEDCQQHCQQRW